MKRFALMLFPLFLACAADAQIYQWKDSNGKTIISDKPPAGQVNQQRKIETGQPPAASATQRAWPSANWSCASADRNPRRLRKNRRKIKLLQP